MWTVAALLTGEVRCLTDKGDMSAIVKSAVDGARGVTYLGIAGDMQADLRVHGGPDKAIHHYPRDHYRWWQDRLPTCGVLDTVGAFGENISIDGLTERDVSIGDRFRLGSALVEVCQGRQPCWKQAHRLGDKSVVGAMVKSGRTGWYYRVLEEGSVAGGDALVRVARPHAEWSVERVTGIVVGGRERNASTLRELAALPALAEDWRRRVVRLAG